MAQLSANGWKIMVLIITLFFVFNNSYGIAAVLNVLLIFMIVFSFILLFFVVKNIRFSFNNEISLEQLINSFVFFFINITGFSFLIFGDRFIVEYKMGVEEFGNYFYLTTLILAPFSILQNYTGFKQLVNFKNNFNIQQFNYFNKKNIIIGTGLSLFIVLVLIIVNSTHILSFNFINYKQTILLLLILGIVRLYDAGITAAFEALTNIINLKYSNLIVISALTVTLSILFYLPVNINEIILIFIFLWLIKSIVNKQLLLNQTLLIGSKINKND